MNEEPPEEILVALAGSLDRRGIVTVRAGGHKVGWFKIMRRRARPKGRTHS